MRSLQSKVRHSGSTELAEVLGEGGKQSHSCPEIAASLTLLAMTRLVVISMGM
jgi:hypothetical protein